MEEVKYNTAYLFPYSMREKTTAHRRFKDDVPEDIKMQRLKKMSDVFRRNAYTLNLSQIGKYLSKLLLQDIYQKKTAQSVIFSYLILKEYYLLGKSHLVLIEGFSKRSVNCLQGRNDNNIKVIVPANDYVPLRNGNTARLLKPGDYVVVHVNSATSQVLKGR